MRYFWSKAIDGAQNQLSPCSKYLKFILFWLGLTLFYTHKNDNEHTAKYQLKESLLKVKVR